MSHGVRMMVTNPAPARRRNKKRKGTAMAKKKRRKHRKNPKKRHARVHHRKRRSNPKRRVHHRRRVARKNPRRSHHKRRSHARRSFRANPRKHHRRRRKNPGSSGGKAPKWAAGAIAAILGVVGFAGANAAAYALTQRLDPSMATLYRNRYIASGLLVIGGIALLKKKPIYGLGLAAGAAAAALGPPVNFWLGNLLDNSNRMSGGSAPATTQGSVYGQKMGVVYGQNMGDYTRMGAYQPMGSHHPQLGAYQPMGQVYGQTMGGLGDFVPQAPWQMSTPFGF